MNQQFANVVEIEKNGELTVLKDGDVTSPLGFYAGGLYCGIKRKRHDLGWIYSKVPAAVGAVYTTNLFKAAPLIVNEKSIAVDKKLQAILVNSGVANACTGEQGIKDAYQMRVYLAKHMSLKEHHVAVLSTGVIGKLLPLDKIDAGVQEIKDWDSDKRADLFEKAIMTTDLSSKNFGVEMIIDGKKVTIGGAAKGSGMINPNMATMLAFITTDANVEQQCLQEALKLATQQTFNMIAVDGDTSTNDMVLTLANGLAENNLLDSSHPEWNTFVQGLTIVCQELAKKIARDGEGASKLIEVQVNNASDEKAAQVVSKTIIRSSLVKTAIYGADPNWGRIICAIGYAGVPLDPNKVQVSLGSVSVVENGMGIEFDEDELKDYLQEEYIKIYVDLNQGSSSAIAWGCDLTYDYVKINASYRS